ncbi:glycosylphosphatidylinositol anchor biosynthesis [Tulasnella sp. JGI-2019a]|nr:glycosylphosphatidylinositol anchor biosynthesis [Tulasnella sp. JGI-2019a]KAG9012988.1 glycosylphosphatidylinositol anchor biosynthesis [Tulasnella sp. JGI-2019a]
MTGFDSGSLLILAPKALGGVLAAVTDLYVWRFASRWGREYGRVALFFSLLSSFNALALSRILSSSLETSLTIAALFYWPFVPSQINHRDLPLSLSFAAFSCLIRPTGAVIWVFLWHSLLFSARHHPQWVSIVGDTFSVGRAAFILLAIDTLYYKKLTFTPWNFIRVNLSSLSSSYGSQPSHDYIARALLVVCGTYFPWFPWSVLWTYGKAREIPSTLRSLLYILLITIGVYSLSSHKEWRVIHPLLPFFHLLAAKHAVDQYRRSEQGKAD